MADDPHTAAEQSARRDRMIAELESKPAEWSGKLDAQDAGRKGRGRKLSDDGARARF